LLGVLFFGGGFFSVCCVWQGDFLPV